MYFANTQKSILILRTCWALLSNLKFQLEKLRDETQLSGQWACRIRFWKTKRKRCQKRSRWGFSEFFVWSTHCTAGLDQRLWSKGPRLENINRENSSFQTLIIKKFRFWGEKSSKKLEIPCFFLSQLLCWVIFHKIYGLFSYLSAGEAILSYENYRKKWSLGQKTT